MLQNQRTFWEIMSCRKNFLTVCRTHAKKWMEKNRSSNFRELCEEVLRESRKGPSSTSVLSEAVATETNENMLKMQSALDSLTWQMTELTSKLGRQRTATICNYCHKYGHKEADCRKKAREQGSGGANNRSQQNGAQTTSQQGQQGNA
jgi:hypothetical protein